LMEEQYRRFGQPIELHFYGGEPMMRKRYVEHVAKKAKALPYLKQFVLYTTLLSNSPKGVYDILGRELLSIIVNPSTVNDKVEKRIEELKEVVYLYRNQVFFPTGRGAVGEEGNQPNFWQRWLPIGFPARSCFATSSGMLVNGQQHTIHLCCLPQSPIIGTFHDSAAKLWNIYEENIVKMSRTINQKARERKCVHPCQVCNIETGYQSQAGSGCNSYDLSAWQKVS